MAITDAERHNLHTKFDELIGKEHAAVLMEHLPPSGWSDVARTRDLDQLEARMNAQFGIVGSKFEGLELRFEAMEHKFEAALERSLREQTNKFMLAMGAMLSVLVTVVTLFS